MLRKIYKELWTILREPYFGRLVASMTLTTALAISPFLAVLLSMAKVFGRVGEYLESVRPLILEYLASGVGDEFLEGIEAAVANLRFEALGVLGVIFLFAAATRLIQEVDSSVKLVWGEKSESPLWKRVLVYWLFLFLGPLALSIVLGVLDLTEFFRLRKYLGTFVLVPLLSGGLGLIFFFTPRTKVRWTFALLSSVLTSFLFLFAQKAYVYATKNVFSYNEIYGSLAILPLFLIWIMVVWYIFLFGVALTKALHDGVQEHRESL